MNSDGCYKYKGYEACGNYYKYEGYGAGGDNCWWWLNNVKGDVACGENAVELVIELVLDMELLVVTEQH